MHSRSFLETLTLLFAAARLRAQSKSMPNQGDQPIAEAAKDFVAALRPELRARARFAMDDPERKDWSNLPHYLHPRKGVRLGDMNPAERAAAPEPNTRFGSPPIASSGTSEMDAPLFTSVTTRRSGEMRTYRIGTSERNNILGAPKVEATDEP